VHHQAGPSADVPEPGESDEIVPGRMN